jgi:hypothetical protein
MYVYVEDSKAVVYILLIMFQISLHYNKNNNQNVDIKFSVHDSLLEEPLTGNA